MLCDFDSEWSEVEEMIGEIKADIAGEEEENFLTQVLVYFGTLGLVFYNRFKESQILKDIYKDLPPSF